MTATRDSNHRHPVMTLLDHGVPLQLPMDLASHPHPQDRTAIADTGGKGSTPAPASLHIER
jgi:hypothetical protein